MKPTHAIYSRWLLLTIIALLLITCQSKNESNSTASDEAAIRKVVEEALVLVTGLNKDNSAEFVKFWYAEDAIIFPPNGQPIKGFEDMIKFFQTYPPMTDYKQKPMEIVVFGDYAYLWETWSVTLPLTEKTSFKDTGTIFWIWHKQKDGSWKLWREIWHSDIPAPDSTSTSRP
jgi:ketosteroid isomerase-like protein